MTQPTVTIGIPAFDSARTLARAIASVRAQTRADWLLLLADDGSTDGTWEICRAAAGDDPRITAWRQPARRMFMNFGDLAARAQTPWFAWLAADDYWAPEFLEACLATIAAHPEAVSVLPRCAFVGEEDRPGPNTETLDGPAPDRLRRYLEHPGGTRMYGLTRTPVLQAAFPKRNMNAYDWHLMLGVLRAGPQIEVPRVLLFREKTDPMRYAEVVDELYATRLYRRFPVLDMSLRAVLAGHVPVSVLWALLRLNGRKHVEYLAVTRPDEFARRIWLLRRFGTPLAAPAAVVAIAEQLIRRDPRRRDGAVAMLSGEVGRGNAGAAIALGHARRDGLVPGDAAAAYAEAAALGAADGLYHETRARLARGELAPDEASARILGAAHRGSAAARRHLRDQTAADGLPVPVRDVAAGLPAGTGATSRSTRRMPMPGATPPLTAVLTCRNVADTLARHLDHLQDAGARVILIDNGSTDATMAIAAERRGAPVAEILHEPYDGTFDLTRQLRLKREVLQSVREGWVIHADADEFLDAPDGRPLPELLARLDAGAVLAVPCRELVFLPRSEAERHDPERFEATMRAYAPVRERDPKQRLFRAGAPLDRWMATGGHTVTVDRDRIAPDVLTLRHYPGLSLDHLRAKYLGRVFAAGDLAKRWHGHRLATMRYDIVEPPAGALRDADADGLAPEDPAVRLPVFAHRKHHVEAPATLGDLVVVGARGRSLDSVLKRIAARFGGLRAVTLCDNFESLARPVGVPVLQVLQHPAGLADRAADEARLRRIGIDWVRRVARTRQVALSPGVAYAEMRVEDAETDVGRIVQRLLLGQAPRAETAILPAGVSHPRSADDYPEPLRTITGPLARDLGYV